MKKKRVWESKKDHESNISKYRVAMGYTVHDLAKEIGCRQIDLSNLINWMALPYYIRKGVSGQIKPYVTKLCEVLMVPIDELFPRYYCDMERNAAKDLLECQHEGVTVANRENHEQADIRIDLEPMINALPKRLRTIVYKRFWLGETWEEIGSHYGVCKARAAQLGNAAIRKLRNNFYKQHI